MPDICPYTSYICPTYAHHHTEHGAEHEDVNSLPMSGQGENWFLCKKCHHLSVVTIFFLLLFLPVLHGFWLWFVMPLSMQDRLLFLSAFILLNGNCGWSCNDCIAVIVIQHH